MRQLGRLGRAVTVLKDIARFDASDDAALVAASFCCQLCLSAADAVIVVVEHASGQAWCYCADCEVHTEVALSADQIIRLTLAPPRGAPIHMLRPEDVE